MTSPIGTNNERGGAACRDAFTLVELILVMALLAAVAVSSAPAMSRFFQGRRLDQEATRFLALTEFARSEAISQGVPMVVWAEPETGSFGVMPQEGYPSRVERTRTYRLHGEITITPGAGGAAGIAGTDLMRFVPDGTLDQEAVESVTLTDRSGARRVIARPEAEWSYEILDPTTDEPALLR